MIKLEDLNVLPLEEIARKLDKKYGKITVEDHTNEISEKLDLGKTEIILVKNVIPKSK